MESTSLNTWLMTGVGGLSALVLLVGIATTLYPLPAAIGGALALRILGAALINRLIR